MEKAKRPKQLTATTIKIGTGCGNLYVTIAEHEGKPFEVFGTLGKAGGCPKCYAEAVTRCVTLGLRYGIPIAEFIKQLEGISCPNPSLEEGVRILSCPDGIAKAMKMSIKV